jgi:hypothetical protein
MAGAVTNELIYEILKHLQADMAVVKMTLADHSRQFVELRKQINGLQGEVIRLEERIVGVDTRLDRIEARLNLVEA